MGSSSKAAESVVRHLGFDANNAIIQELREESQALALAQKSSCVSLRIEHLTEDPFFSRVGRLSGGRWT